MTAPAFVVSTRSRMRALSPVGTLRYERAWDLPRLLAMWPGEISDETLAGRARVVGRLRQALRAERQRAVAGHWTYDVTRHAQLVTALRAETAAFSAQRKAAVQKGYLKGLVAEDSIARPRGPERLTWGRPAGDGVSKVIRSEPMTAKPDQRKPVPERTAFRHFATIPSRWADNDVYGHINNAVYYFYFDTAVNRYLIDHGGLVIADSTVVGIVIETGCRYHKSFTYPEDIEAGIRVVHLGTSSVRYEVGLFASGEALARADGHFVHVYVDRKTMRPTPIPAGTRRALERIAVNI